MKIAVMGAGGVGGVFGGRLWSAGTDDVTFVARGSHLAAVKRQGLSIISPMLADINVSADRFTEAPKDIGPVDIVLFCVKLWDTEQAAESIKPLIGPNTAVISLQNGIQKDVTLGRILGKEHVVGGISYVAATIKDPGVIDQRGTVQKLVVGEYSGETTPRLQAFQKACQSADIECIVSNNVQKVIWEKFIYLVAMSSVLAATRQTIGPVRSNQRTRALLVDVMTEAVALGRAKGVDIDDALLERHMQYFDGLAPEVTASMQHDLSVGNRLELPWLAGSVVELGKQLNVPTPVTRVLFDVLSPFINGTEG